MNNYVYIVAGLPELHLSFEDGTFSYQEVRDYFYAQLSDKDRTLVDLLEESFVDEKLNADFYQETGKCANAFLRQYFQFDLQVRNRKVYYLAKRLDKSPDQYVIPTENVDFEEENKLQDIFLNADFVSREQQMDQLKWEKISELTRTDYLNLNVILGFLLKAKIVERWSKLDKKTGEDMFSRLVKEVHGTFSLSESGKN